MTPSYLCVWPSLSWAISSPFFLAPGKDGWPTKSCNCFTSSCCPAMLTCGWTELQDLGHFWWGDGSGRSGIWGDVCFYTAKCSVDRPSRDRPIIKCRYKESWVHTHTHISLSLSLSFCNILAKMYEQISLSVSLSLSLSLLVSMIYSYSLCFFCSYYHHCYILLLLSCLLLFAPIYSSTFQYAFPSHGWTLWRLRTSQAARAVALGASLPQGLGAAAAAAAESAAGGVLGRRVAPMGRLGGGWWVAAKGV